jgi:hypothetical protein
MGKMKDIFTEMQELGIDPTTKEGQAKFEELVEERFPGRIPKQGTFESLPLTTQEQIRKANPNAQFEEAVQQKFQHAKHVLLSKHKDYGPKNIAHSPGGPLNGLRVRMWDKFARINNLIDSKKNPQHESLRDSFLDMANYAIIAMLVLDGEWPDE